MAVNLNLLGDSAAEERPAAGWSFAASSCLFLLIVTLSAILYEYCLFDSLNKKRITAEEGLCSARNEMSTLDSKFGDAEARLKSAEEILDFMLGDVRAGEILPLLTVCAEKGVVVERLEVTEEGMTLFGKAKNEQSVSEMYKVFVASGLFSSIGEICPVSDADSGLNFTLKCDSADSQLYAGATDAE